MNNERYKQLMNDVGLPNSRSLLTALRQVENEVSGPLLAEVERLRSALSIIAGYEQCIDNTLGNVEIARIALEQKP